jgi:hypothetical protein
VQGPWIKVEKSLREDPRIITMADKLGKQIHLKTGAQLPLRLLCITCVGAVINLWMAAEADIDESDAWHVPPSYIDELTGIEGICQILPADWLQVLSEYSVKLPGFHTHNGTYARKKANGAKRQQKYRNTHLSPRRHR